MTDKEFFDMYNKDVYRTCLYMLGNATEAEDACQEVFIKVFMQDWRSIEYLKTWLIKIAINQCLSQLRKNHGLQSKQQLLQFLSNRKEKTTESIIEEKETSDELSGILAKLPEKIRATVTLRYLNELSLTEISDVLNIPVGTVKSRINKGLKLLKKSLEGETAYEQRRKAFTALE